MKRLTNKKTSDYIHNKLEKIRERMKDDTVSACFNSAYDDMYEIEKYNKDELRYEKLGQLEDIEERLQKYKEFGINDLVSLFSKLNDEDIERFVLMTFKTERIISQKIFPNSKLQQYKDIEEELGIDLITLFTALKNGIYHKYLKLDGQTYSNEIYFEEPEHLSIGLKGLICAYTDCFGDDLRYDYKYKDYYITWALTKEELE